MKKERQTEAEKKYRRLERRNTIGACFIIGLAASFGVLFLFARSEDLKALYGCLMSLCVVLPLLTGARRSEKRAAYLRAVQDERYAVSEAGTLFREVYDAYKRDELKLNLIYDKLLFEEYCNNVLTVSIQRNEHEFLIDVDKGALFMIVDEENENSAEREMSLSDLATMEQLYSVINHFIEEHS